MIIEVAFPAEVGVAVDVAPLVDGDRSTWLVLDADDRIGRWDLTAGSYRHLATATVPSEAGRQVWNGRTLRRRLHAAADGTFAAVVNDYGRFGEVLDLRSGRVTMVLDNGGDHDETVPFSLAFAQHGGSTVVVHRTGWRPPRRLRGRHRHAADRTGRRAA